MGTQEYYEINSYKICKTLSQDLNVKFTLDYHFYKNGKAVLNLTVHLQLILNIQETQMNIPENYEVYNKDNVNSN